MVEVCIVVCVLVVVWVCLVKEVFEKVQGGEDWIGSGEVIWGVYISISSRLSSLVKRTPRNGNLSNRQGHTTLP